MQIVNTPTTTLATPPGHAHAADLEALSDLINSEELDGHDGVPEEHLPTVDDAIAFFSARGLAHEASIRAQAESGPGGGRRGSSACMPPVTPCARCGTLRSRRGHHQPRRSTP